MASGFTRLGLMASGFTRLGLMASGFTRLGLMASGYWCQLSISQQQTINQSIQFLYRMV
jgi:hypothetical protein